MNIRKGVLLPLAAAAIFSAGATAAPVTYQLYDWSAPFTQTQLGGSITVDDADGNLVIAPAEVVDWSFSGTVFRFGTLVDGPFIPLPFSMVMGPGSQLDCDAGGCFKLDGLDLVLDMQRQGPTQFRDAAGARVDVAGDRGLSGDAMAGDRIVAMRWFNTFGSSLAMDSVTSLPAYMRVARTTEVPEPSSLALLTVAMAAAAGAHRVHRRAAAGQPKS